jgi:hypothetical protein
MVQGRQRRIFADKCPKHPVFDLEKFITILQMIEEMHMRVDNFSSAAHETTFVKTGIIAPPSFPVR